MRAQSSLGNDIMHDPETQAFAADAANMTDDELMDTWETASDEEREAPSPLLTAVVHEMGKREIPLQRSPAP